MSARQKKSVQFKKKQLQPKQISTLSKSKTIRNIDNQNPQKTHNKNHHYGHLTTQNTPNHKLNMEKMFEANKEYLMDKSIYLQLTHKSIVAINQIPKPSKYYHKIPSSTPNTTYNNQYHRNMTNSTNFKINQLKLERKDNLFNCNKNVTNYESLYVQNFNKNQRSQSLVSTFKKDNPFKTLDSNYQREKKNKYQPNDAPTFLDTSYHLNFPGNFHPVPAQSAKRNECKLMGGGKFSGQSTYHGTFSCKNIDKNIKKQTPITHQDNKIFMSIVQPKQTTYDYQFNSHPTIPMSKSVKIDRKEQGSNKKSSLNSEKNRSINGTKLSGRNSNDKNKQQLTETKQFQKKKFKSQYERSFRTIQPDGINSLKNKNVSLMTIQEMKNLILNVL